jgi:hypothetical protein
MECTAAVGCSPGAVTRCGNVAAHATGAGFGGVDAVLVYRALFGFLHGHVLTELQEVVERPDETDDVLRLGLHRLHISEFPHLRALAPTWATYDGLTELDRGHDILLSGLAAQLAFPDGRPAQTHTRINLTMSPRTDTTMMLPQPNLDSAPVGARVEPDATFAGTSETR